MRTRTEAQRRSDFRREVAQTKETCVIPSPRPSKKNGGRFGSACVRIRLWDIPGGYPVTLHNPAQSSVPARPWLPAIACVLLRVDQVVR